MPNPEYQHYSDILKQIRKDQTKQIGQIKYNIAGKNSATWKHTATISYFFPKLTFLWIISHERLSYFTLEVIIFNNLEAWKLSNSYSCDNDHIARNQCKILCRRLYLHFQIIPLHCTKSKYFPVKDIFNKSEQIPRELKLETQSTYKHQGLLNTIYYFMNIKSSAQDQLSIKNVHALL